MGDRRVHYRRKNSYRTRSNIVKIVKTPGGRNVVQYQKKTVSAARTPYYLGHKELPGVKRLRSADRSRTTKKFRTVNRAYGGVLTHDLLRERIVRAFLIEEQKIVKRVLKTKQAPKAGKQ